MQGTLLFLGLLVLLWVPLIVFSSGNPTYKVILEAKFLERDTSGVAHVCLTACSKLLESSQEVATADSHFNTGCVYCCSSHWSSCNLVVSDNIV